MKKTRIQYIKEAAKKLVDSKLQRLNAAKTQEIFQGVMQTVGLESLEEVYLFVAQFDLTCRDRTSNMDDLSSYFECSSLDMLEFIPALKSLERKGLLVRRYKRESNIFKQQFVVSDVVMADIIDNRPVTIGKVDVGNVQTDKYEFCKSIAEKADDDEVVTDDLVLFTEKQEQSCAQLSLVKKIRKDQHLDEQAAGPFRRGCTHTGYQLRLQWRTDRQHHAKGAHAGDYKRGETYSQQSCYYMQRGKHFQKQPQEDRISGIKNRQPSTPTLHMLEWRVVIFRFPVKNHMEDPT